MTKYYPPNQNALIVKIVFFQKIIYENKNIAFKIPNMDFDMGEGKFY